jgi:hypothetical protein
MSMKMPSDTDYFKHQKSAGASEWNKGLFHSKHKDKLKQAVESIEWSR